MIGIYYMMDIDPVIVSGELKYSWKNKDNFEK